MGIIYVGLMKVGTSSAGLGGKGITQPGGFGDDSVQGIHLLYEGGLNEYQGAIG